MIINDLDDYYIVFDTKNRNTELDTLFINKNECICIYSAVVKVYKVRIEYRNAIISVLLPRDDNVKTVIFPYLLSYSLFINRLKFSHFLPIIGFV